MGRSRRATEGGYAYHVLNRANAQLTIFEGDGDYEAFERALGEAVERTGTRLLAYCVMPNHWHLVVWPRENGELSRFAGWLTLTHTQRWHAYRKSIGSGHVYQGRFKSFPIQEDEHFYTVARYVERNALRANLTRRAEHWRWGSLHRWLRGSAEDKELLAPWPLSRRPNWVDHVNAPQTESELAALRRSVRRGCPFGDGDWSDQAAVELGIESTLRPRGRPGRKGV
jgi:putative transposase